MAVAASTNGKRARQFSDSSRPASDDEQQEDEDSPSSSSFVPHDVDAWHISGGGVDGANITAALMVETRDYNVSRYCGIWLVLVCLLAPT